LYGFIISGEFTDLPIAAVNEPFISEIIPDNDNVHNHAHICEVISLMLVLAVTSYPIFSHRIDHDDQVKRKQEVGQGIGRVARIDEGKIRGNLDTNVKSTIVSGSYSQRIHSKQEIQI
jgi:nucleoside diphosphate kinase